MTQFIQLFVLGMATGGFYTMNALGIVVVFRSSGIINFASGGTAMVAGYLEWQFADQMNLPQWLGVTGAVLSAAVVSVLIYWLAIRPLAAASTLTQVIATLAILVSLQQVVLLVFGSLPKVPKPFLPTKSVHIGSIAEGADSLTTLVAAAVLTLVLWSVYRWTRFGVATGALAENPRSLAALGWNIGGLRAVNWFIAGGLAGLAGVGLGPILQLSTANFTNLLIPTLASAILGGLQSFPLTLVGGLLIGAAQAEAGLYLTWNGSATAVPFLLIIVVLVVRGRKLPLRSFVQQRLPRAGSGEIQIVRVAFAVLLLVVLAFVVKDEWVIGATFTVFSAIFLLSQVVITGYAGQLSLAQLSMGGVGAIVAARIAASLHTPFLLSLLIGMVAVVPVSVVVGLPSQRARGVSLAIATLGFAVSIQSLVLLNPSLDGGLNGLTLDSPNLFGLSIDATLYPRRYFVVSLAVFVVLAAAVANLRRGRMGRRMLAVRNNERAAAALGINVTGVKLYAFVVAGIIAGAGGTLMVLAQSLPQFNNFDPLTGLSNLVNSVLGGIGYIPGAVIGGLANNDGLPNAIINPLVMNLSWWANFFPLAIGVVVVLQLISNPDGIADVIARGTPGKARRKKARARTAGLSAEARGKVVVDTAPIDVEAADPAALGLHAATDDSAPGGAATSGNGTDPTATRDGKVATIGRGGGRAHFGLGVLATALPKGNRRAQTAKRQRQYVRDIAAANTVHRMVGSSLVARHITVKFGSVTAVDDVSVEVAPGEVLAVIGPNGAGKTTLMDAITGFVGMRGEIELDGVRLERLSATRRSRAGIARSFQSLELLEDMTVMANLRCAADPQDAGSMLYDFVRPARGRVTAATASAIKTFGLQNKLALLPTEIAYGDRRLVAIARAVASEPAVLLLDEPAAGLSERERAEVTRVITMMAREWNIAVMLIEHDVEMVRAVADRVIALDFGRQIASGSASQVLADPAVIEAYLGTPVEETMSASNNDAGRDDDGEAGPPSAVHTVPTPSHEHTETRLVR